MLQLYLFVLDHDRSQFCQNEWALTKMRLLNYCAEHFFILNCTKYIQSIKLNKAYKGDLDGVLPLYQNVDWNQ